MFGRFIEAEDLKKLKAYKYQVEPVTWLDDFLQRRWWNFAVEFVPEWVAPNVLTLLGLLCTVLAVSICLRLSNPPLTGPCAPWCLFAGAILLFAHQTLDGIDGQHARRTGTSSPLGQLFDHGCDAFSVVFIGLCACAACRTGITMTTFGVLTAVELLLFSYSWIELHTAVFRCNTGSLGVIEGQFIVMIFMCTIGCLELLSVDYLLRLPVTVRVPPILSDLMLWYCGYGDGEEGGLEIPFVHCFAFPFYTSIAGLAIWDMVRHFWNVDDRMMGLRQILAFVVHLFFQYFFFFSGTFESWPLLSLWMIAANCGIFIIRIQICAVFRVPNKGSQWPLIPFYVVAFVLYSMKHSGWHYAYAPLPYCNYMPPLLLIGSSLWTAAFLYDLISKTIHNVCRELDIFCFSIKKQSGDSELSAQFKTLHRRHKSIKVS